MIIVSTRIKGDDRIELIGDDGKEYHFINAENAAYWMSANTTGLPTLASISPTTAVSGAANTTVTLTGTNFNTSSQVLVNNVPVSRTYVSPTSMTTILATSTIVGSRLWQISVRNGVYQTAAKPFSFTTTDLAPSFTVEADITGAEAVGSTLTCDNGTVIGSPTPTITKQWKRNGTNIPAATGNTYLLALPDQGTVVTCLVTATNASGSAASIPSTGIIAETPVGTSSVTITQDGLVMTFTSGSADLTLIQDAIGMYGIVAPSGLTITALPTIDPTRTTENVATLGTANYVGGIMVDPEGLLMQGFDNRSTGGFGPSMNYSVGLKATLPLTVNAASKPKTVWLYRGLDTVQGGGSNCGCAFMVQVTVFATAPPSGWIRPSIYSGDKTVYTTSSINYSAFTPVALPSGAVEKDWSNIHYLRRPLIQNSEYQIGLRLPSTCNPCGSQDPYPAYQAEWTGDLLLGAVSTSSSRNDLINRIVACGIDLEAQSKWGGAPCVSGGGFGCGYAMVRYFAGKFLGIDAMQSRPPLADIGRLGGSQVLVDYFAEDGNAFLGAVAAGYADGKPLFGIVGAGYPTGPYADNHSARDPAGLREPWWLLPTAMTLTGTVVSGSANTIQLAAATPAGIVLAGNRVYNSRGGGQTLQISSWNDTTKTATMTANWASAPQAGDTYEYYNGGSYMGLNMKPLTAHFAALVLAGYGIQWLNPVAMALQKRWVDEGALFTPTVRMVQDASQDTSQFQTWTRAYNGDSGGTWCKKFYDAAIATGNWPTVPSASAPTISTLSPVDGSLTVATGANLVVTFSEAISKGTGNIIIRNTADDSVFQTIDVTSGAVSIAGAVATITHTAFLNSGQYYVRIDYNAFKDASNNPFFGIHDKVRWNFAVVTAGSPYTEQSAGPSEGANQGAGATYFDISWAVNNNATITSLGIYCAGSNSGSVTMRIAKRDSPGVYSTVASTVATAIANTGWNDISLSAPFLIPASGTYNVSVYATANVWDRWTTNRAYNGGGDVFGASQTFTELAAVNGPMTRATGTTP